MESRFRLCVVLLSFGVLGSTACTQRTEYDECILENMKGVSSDAAAAAVEAACKRGKSQAAVPKINNGVCSVYWDGWKIQEGQKPGDGYNTITMTRYGKDALALHIPIEMRAELGLARNTAYSDRAQWSPAFEKFFASNLPAIEAICNR